MEERKGVLVGRTVAIRRHRTDPAYFTDVHRRWIGKSGRVHAVAAGSKDNPLVKVGFEGGTKIVFFRLADLEVRRDEPLPPPEKHGMRGSHLPKNARKM